MAGSSSPPQGREGADHQGAGWWRSSCAGIFGVAELDEGRFLFHSRRHFCASALLAKGAPITAVAGHLGDPIETVSRVYAHWLRDDRDTPADILDPVLAPEPDAAPQCVIGLRGRSEAAAVLVSDVGGGEPAGTPDIGIDAARSGL